MNTATGRECLRESAWVLRCVHLAVHLLPEYFAVQNPHHRYGICFSIADGLMHMFSSHWPTIQSCYQYTTHSISYKRQLLPFSPSFFVPSLHSRAERRKDNRSLRRGGWAKSFCRDALKMHWKLRMYIANK